MKFKLILGSAISTLYLILPGHYGLAQSQQPEEQPSTCQLRAQQPRTDEHTPAHRPSSQLLLAAKLEAICRLNDQQPRTDDSAIATDDNPSPDHFTVPSLWWHEQQVGEAINSRLIDSWRAYDNTINTKTGQAISHVDVVINSQLWPLLNYLERYSLITQFGESAQSYGYQLRIFTGNRLVGLQVCDFANDSSTPTCVVELNYFGQGAIRGGRRR